MLNAHPKVDRATPSGIRNENDPRVFSPKVNPTASELIISFFSSTIMYAMFMKTYKPVIIGTAIAIDRGMFLNQVAEKKKI